MIEVSTILALGVAVVLSVILSLALLNQRRKAKRIRQKYRQMEVEEQRMFTFLHELGSAIGQEPSAGVLSRMIVDGVYQVVSAKGGAIYLNANESGYLNPSYVSEDCPPLVGVPVEVRKKAERDPRALESHLRLARVEASEGILGHCLSMGEPIHVTDVKSHAAFRDAFTHYVGDVSAMVAPLKYAGKDIGVLAVARCHAEGEFSHNDFAVFRSAAEQSAFAIGNARIHREANEKKAIEGELRNAREVQRVLLPQEDPVVAGFRVNGTNLPAKIISGDYYDYVDLGPGKLGVAIADVSGKGVAAGLLMAMCRSLLRAVARRRDSPAAVLAAVNRYLFPDIREDMFISMAYGVLDSEEGTLTFARAGHDPALIYRKLSGDIETLRPKGLALGIDAGDVFERVTEDEVVRLSPGDCVLFYTDGVKEALNDEEEEFGMERLADAFRQSAVMGAEAIVTRVQEAVKEFTGEGPQMDDVTIVAIEKR